KEKEQKEKVHQLQRSYNHERRPSGIEDQKASDVETQDKFTSSSSTASSSLAPSLVPPQHHSEYGVRQVDKTELPKSSSTRGSFSGHYASISHISRAPTSERDHAKTADSLRDLAASTSKCAVAPSTSTAVASSKDISDKPVETESAAEARQSSP